MVGRDFLTTPECRWVLDHYGINPVFLASEGADFLDAMREVGPRPQAELEVDERGLPLMADLAALADHGAVLRGGAMRWDRRPPLDLAPFLDPRGQIPIRRLLDPTDEACVAAIRTTGTAACPVDPSSAASLLIHGEVRRRPRQASCCGSPPHRVRNGDDASPAVPQDPALP